MSDDAPGTPAEASTDQDASQDGGHGGAGGQGPGQQAAEPKGGEPQDTGSGPPETTTHPDAVTAGGDGFREATSQPGSGTQRQEYLRASQHILGDQVGVQNVYFAGGQRSIRLHRLSSRLAAEVKHAFVKPSGWGDLHLRFQRQNTVVLRGPAGRGRAATAVRLLQAAQVTSVYDLEPEVDLGDLAALLDEERKKPERLEAGAAFLLQEPDVARLRAGVLNALQEALGETGRLVVIIRANASIVDDEVQRHVVDLPPAPDLSEILREHLRWLVGDLRADRILVQDGVQDLILELLTDDASCVIAAQLAERLSWEPEDGFNLDRVRGGMVRRVADTFAEWFDGLPDLSTRTFGIALAALDGRPYAAVARAASSLHRRLDQTQKVVLVPTVEDPTQVRSQKLLRDLRAETAPGEVWLHFGNVPAIIVRYRRDTVAHQVLQLAWLGYQIQDELLDWLRELIDDDLDHIRLFAGTALGVLATLSFDRVCNDVLVSLASDDRPGRREAVAVALKAVSADERLLPVVRSLAGRWLAQSDHRLQATAARVHGLVLGQRGLQSTLDALGRLATVDNIHVAVAIGYALTDLIAADPEGNTSAVYAAMLAWLDDYKRAPTTHLAFLSVAVNTVAYARVDGTQDDRPGLPSTTWPGLLYLAMKHPDWREGLFTMWHRVLDEGAMFEAAERVLTGWAGRGEANALVLDAFARMIRAVAAHGPRTRASLFRIVDEWVDPYRLSPLPKAATSLAAVLGSREEGYGWR